MATRAGGSVVSLDAGQVLVAFAVRASSSKLVCSAEPQDLFAGGFESVGLEAAGEPCIVGQLVQPVPRGSSLVASFRSLQTSPRNGFASSLGAKVPYEGPSGGTAWRL